MKTAAGRLDLAIGAFAAADGQLPVGYGSAVDDAERPAYKSRNIGEHAPATIDPHLPGAR
jgi:hypothetical protein